MSVYSSFLEQYTLRNHTRCARLTIYKQTIYCCKPVAEHHLQDLLNPGKIPKIELLGRLGSMNLTATKSLYHRRCYCNNVVATAVTQICSVPCLMKKFVGYRNLSGFILYIFLQSFSVHSLESGAIFSSSRLIR